MKSIRFVGSLDQGTTSTRFLIFNSRLELVVGHQKEHRQITAHPGWLEHDAEEIAANAEECMEEAMKKFKAKFPDATVDAIGITNQRETTVAWSKQTGAPLANAIVWSDVRTQQIVSAVVAANGNTADFARSNCGLPCSTYFSAVKMAWMLRNVPAVKAANENDDLMFGTIDSWLIYVLSGRAVHVTDCSNASRTMLMDLTTLAWDPQLCGIFGVNPRSLPRIVSSSEKVAVIADGPLKAVPISGCIGDQQAALFGQLCFRPGQAKNTYGTGCFLLANVGNTPKQSKNGLLTTVAYRIGSEPCTYALEGAIAGAGSTIQWMRDKLGFYANAKECEALAQTVEDTGGVVFVPAFSGLLAPHWKPDARGTIVGLTLQSSKAHITRAALEAIAHQVTSVVHAMERDAGFEFESLSVDGGMVANALLMQMQADLLGLPMRVPRMLETTALGAALCAGLATGVWRDVEELRQVARKSGATQQVQPAIDAQERAQRIELWQRGLQRAMNWAKL